MDKKVFRLFVQTHEHTSAYRGHSNNCLNFNSILLTLNYNEFGMQAVTILYHFSTNLSQTSILLNRILLLQDFCNLYANSWFNIKLLFYKLIEQSLPLGIYVIV